MHTCVCLTFCVQMGIAAHAPEGAHLDRPALVSVKKVRRWEIRVFFFLEGPRDNESEYGSIETVLQLQTNFKNVFMKQNLDIFLFVFRYQYSQWLRIFLEEKNP
jgi:hypothetical protein